DLFAIVWDGAAMHGLNGSGRSPAALTLETVRDGVPDHGWLPVTVPGAPAGWRDLHERFGVLPFEELFTDAIRYAEQGYPVAPRTARNWRLSVAAHSTLAGPEFDEWTRVYTVDGRAPGAGQPWHTPHGARTLRLIAGSRAEQFYRGEIAEAAVRHAERTGGLLTAEDLAGHASIWVPPICQRYRGHEVW